MAVVGDAFIKLRADGKGLGAEIEKSSRGGLSKFKSAAGTAFKVAGVAAVGAFGAAVAVGIGKLKATEQVFAQTNAAIKSTGAVANVSASEVGTLADSISNLSGVDDDAIQSGANLLLTFTNIRNEVGEGNDVFNQAVKSLTDVSVAMGQEPQAAAVQLGKALNNPIKGIAALSRVGIEFTDEQKNLIASLQESGDIMGAQKIILEELNTQFGGSAEAFGETLPGAISKAKQSFEVLAESAVKGLGPVFKQLPALVDALGPVFEALAPVINVLAEVIVDLLDGAMSALIPIIELVAGLFERFLGPAMEPLVALFDVLGEVVEVVVDVLGDVIDGGEGFLGVFSALADVVRAFSPVLQAVAQVFGAVLSPILTLVANVLQAVAEALVPIAEKLFPILAQVLTKVADALGPVVEALAEGILDVFLAFLPILPKVAELFLALIEAVLPLLDVLLELLPPLVDIVAFLADVLATVLGGALTFVVDLLTSLLVPIIEKATSVFGFLLTPVQSLIGFLADLGDNIRGIVDIFNTLREKGGEAIQRIIDIVSDLITTVRENLANAFTKARDIIVDAVGGLVSIVGVKLDETIAFVIALPGRVIRALSNLGRQLFQAGVDLIQGLIDGVKSTGKKFLRAILELLPGPVQEALKRVFGIQSPSTVMFARGIDLMDGFILGIQSMEGPLERALVGVLGRVRTTADRLDVLSGAGLTDQLLGFDPAGGVQAKLIQPTINVFDSGDPLATAQRIDFGIVQAVTL